MLFSSAIGLSDRQAIATERSGRDIIIIIYIFFYILYFNMLFSSVIDSGIGRPVLEPVAQFLNRPD